MALVILGAPRTKKNSLRVLRVRGRTVVAQSAQHDAWADAAILQLRTQWRRPALTGPVRMAARVYRERDVGDLLNYLAAVSDALEAAGVVKNDRQIVCLDGSALALDRARPRVEVEIAPLDA